MRSNPRYAPSYISGTIQPSMLQQHPLNNGPLPPPQLGLSEPLHYGHQAPPSASFHDSSSSASPSPPLTSSHWPSQYDEMDPSSMLEASTSSSSRLSYFSADLSPSFPQSSSSASTLKQPRQGKSGSLGGPPQPSSKGKGKASAAASGPGRATRKKRAANDGEEGGVIKTLQRKDGTLRTQYSSCGACRLRRVRCNLTDVKQGYLSSPDATALSLIDGELVSASGTVLKCLNCQERGLRCVDSYNPNLPVPPPINRSGPSFASSTSSSNSNSVSSSTTTNVNFAVADAPKSNKAKALRKGKRVLQVEDEFGGSSFVKSTTGSTGTGRKIPELTKAFLTSEFYSAFHTQRPMLDPEDFARRFLVTDPPKADSLGPVGSIIPHVLYAWALSYGVDESGKEAPPPTTNDDRIRRRQRCNDIVTECLGEIDRYSVMRRPTWDGVRVLLMILPLTEDTSPPIERLAMYECAVAQVYSLCSLDSLTYELGVDARSNSARWGNASGEQRPEFLVRARVYWYCFVHEAIKTGLKGGRLIMDEDDLEEFQASGPASHKTLTPSPNGYQLAARYATAPIRLAQACRKIHQALTGPKARRRERVDSLLLKEAWEALESCWEEFHSFRGEEGEGSDIGALQARDMIRFCDGWQVFMFECHSVIREALADRVTTLLETVNAPRLQAMDAEPNTTSATNLIEVQRLHAIAESKCYNLARLVVVIVKRNLGTRFFGYDASLVRDGVYYAASILAVDGGSASDINACLAAFDEMRWAFSKTYERTEKIKSLWASSIDAQEPMYDPSAAPNSVSANLPYPLRPTAMRTRSSEVYPQLPPTLQRMPSYVSETYTDDSNHSSPGDVFVNGAASRNVYASGLVTERPSSGSAYKNRGSLAASLDVTLKLEDNSPEGGVWALPPSHRPGSQSRHPSRGGSGSLGSSPGEQRTRRQDVQLEVVPTDGRYEGNREEEEDVDLSGTGFSVPGSSTFSSPDQGFYPSEPWESNTGRSFAPPQGMYQLSEAMDASEPSSYNYHRPLQPPPANLTYEQQASRSPEVFEPVRYEAPRQHESYSYAPPPLPLAAPTSYSSYPTLSPTNPSHAEQTSSSTYLHQFDLSNHPPTPAESPIHPQRSFSLSYPDPPAYHTPPASLPPVQQLDYQPQFDRSVLAGSSFPPPPPPHYSSQQQQQQRHQQQLSPPLTGAPSHYQYMDHQQQQHQQQLQGLGPPYGQQQQQYASDPLASLPPRGMYDDKQQQDPRAYYAQQQQQQHQQQQHGNPPGGFTSNFPRHG